MATSPDIKNYTIATGYATFQPIGDPDARDLGNIVQFSIANSITKKEHKRSRGGRRTKDYTKVTEVGATAKFGLDEPTGENLAIWAQGDVINNPDGSKSVKGLSNTNIRGTLKCIGDNTEGTKLTWTGDVLLSPTGDYTMIANNDDFATVNLEGEVQQDVDGNFGVWDIVEAT